MKLSHFAFTFLSRGHFKTIKDTFTLQILQFSRNKNMIIPLHSNFTTSLEHLMPVRGIQCPHIGFCNWFAEIQKGGLTNTLHFALTLWTKRHKIQINTRHCFKLFVYMTFT